ncbi:hypothetical protein BKI52_03545 [marine bacterium AO1-C]|nr:hypothetical protein BKI52_03545 [marine bacterium AO1-C]
MFLVILNSTLFAQNTKKLDSLKQAIETKQLTNEQKVDTYNEIINAYDGADSAKVTYYSNLAIALAKKINYTSGLSNTYYNLAWEALTIGNYSSSEGFFNKAYQTAKQVNYEPGLGKAYKGLGIMQQIKGNYPQALSFYQKAVSIEEKLGNEEGVASNYNNMGLLYQRMGDYPKATAYMLKFLKNVEKRNYKRGMARGYNNLGLINFYQKNYHKALEYYQKSLAIDIELSRKGGLATSYYNIGSAYRMLGDHQQALTNLQKGQGVAQETGDKGSLAFGYQILGELAIDQQKYVQAQESLLKSNQLYQNLGEKPNVANNEMTLGKVAYLQKKYPEALQYLKSSSDTARVLQRADIVRDAAELQAKVYDALGNFKKAYQSYQVFKTLADSLFNKENTRKTANLEAQYVFNKKEDSLRVAQAQERQLFKADQERRKANQRSTYIGLGLLAVLFLGLLYFFWNKQKNNQRLNAANEQLELSNQEITANNEEILSINNSLQDALTLVEKQRDEMVSSIHYAQRIQQATLPNPDFIREAFPESFTFYKPRDIVSGDFYWYKKVEPSPIYSKGDGFNVGRILEGFNNEKQVLVVADCTGHGVPGGFLTMLATQALINVVATKGITAPDEILQALDTLFKNLLKTNTTKVRDGMDVTIVVIDKETQKMQFAGAKNSIVLAQGGEVKKIRGDIRSINGHARRDQVREFTTHEIDISQPTTFYLFSDGYIDQFGGGENAKRFSTRRFMQLLQENAAKPMSEQNQVLETTLEDWQGNEEQTDDILVMGVKLS